MYADLDTFLSRLLTFITELSAAKVKQQPNKQLDQQEIHNNHTVSNNTNNTKSKAEVGFTLPQRR